MGSYPDKTSQFDAAFFSLRRIHKPRPPYDEGAFHLSVTFPVEYPFKAPQFRFITPIYHPNIDEKGMMCLTILQYDNWKTTTTVERVIQSLISLLNDPQPERPMRPEIADQIYKDKEAFLRTAREHTKNFAEQRLQNTTSTSNDSTSSSSHFI